MEVARQAQGTLPEGSAEGHQIVAAAGFLEKLLLHDVEHTSSGVGLDGGVSKNRTLSLHYPGMRHSNRSHRSLVLQLQLMMT